MDAYIIGGYRTAVAKSGKGVFKSMRADDLGAAVIKKLMSDFKDLDPNTIDDVICGNATPEAEQGLNLGRMISLMGLDTEKVPGMTVNRYCSSGLETIAIASAKIHAGIADCIIAGGVETMTPIPFGGWRIVPNPRVAESNPSWYWGMGLTAEAVARDYKVGREAQDEFAYTSQMRAIAAIDAGKFKEEIVPIDVSEVTFANGKRNEKRFTVDTDEGIRRTTTLEGLAKLRPVFDPKGTVTAGNASQTSDGASFVMVVSERMLKELGVEPIARLKSYHVSALEPRIMGMGPMYAVPKAIERAGLKAKDIELYELNEAFASQSVAVLNELDLDPEIVNVNGGAIALGHPLGCTGSKLTVQLLAEMKRRNNKHGIVTMCVGTGQGAAGVFELLN